MIFFLVSFIRWFKMNIPARFISIVFIIISSSYSFQSTAAGIHSILWFRLFRLPDIIPNELVSLHWTGMPIPVQSTEVFRRRCEIGWNSSILRRFRPGSNRTGAIFFGSSLPPTAGWIYFTYVFIYLFPPPMFSFHYRSAGRNVNNSNQQ